MRVIAFDSGINHYDDPPPGELTDLAGLQGADRFRFANELRAWIEVNDVGQITDAGYAGRGLIGSTTLQLGALKYRFEAVKLPDLQRGRSVVMAGSGSARPSAAAPVCRCPGGSAASPSCSGRHRWCGRR